MKQKTDNSRPELWAQTGRAEPEATSGQSVPKVSKRKFRQESSQAQAGPMEPSGSMGDGFERLAGPEAGGTSGQSVPKSPKSKFRQKSQQEQAAASKLRMEKQGEKVEKAKEKLAKQKPPKKPGPVKRVGRVAGGSVHSFVHGKIYEVEQENVGTEGAHRSEVLGESVYHHSSRYIRRKFREHPAKALERAEAKFIKRTADYQFHTAAQEHPELSKNALSRYWQKRRLRRQYRARLNCKVK